MPMEALSKQLALSGRLKPEARLGLAISEFAQVLDSDRKNEFRSMQNTQDAQISGRDIIKMTEEINREGARHHRKDNVFFVSIILIHGVLKTSSQHSFGLRSGWLMLRRVLEATWHEGGRLSVSNSDLCNYWGRIGRGLAESHCNWGLERRKAVIDGKSISGSPKIRSYRLRTN